MKARPLLIAVLVVLLPPATSWSSLSDERRQGEELVAQLQAGAKRCTDLSAGDFDRVGEYVMGRALGSLSVHQAMNDRMRLMLGGRGEQRMHELMGRRFTGCLSRSAAGGAAVGMGPGMMGGSYGNGGWGAMMRSGEWSWMTGGAWRAMNRGDWQRLQRQWMAAGATASPKGGWSAGAIVAVTLGGVLIVALAGTGVLAVLRRAWRRPPTARSA